MSRVARTVRVAFDTSVLVAAVQPLHPRHEVALLWVSAAAGGKIGGTWTTHAVAETWAVLTAMPAPARVSASAALAAVRRLSERIPVSPLGPDAYLRALDRCVANNLRSGSVYDALHLISAEDGNADALLTFNTADFERFSPMIKVVEPPAKVGPFSA